MKRGIAITVRYAGPTNSRGGRWVVRADTPDGRLTVPYNHGVNAGFDNAVLAAQALVDRWNEERFSDSRNDGEPAYELIAGGHATDGYAFIACYEEPS